MSKKIFLYTLLVSLFVPVFAQNPQIYMEQGIQAYRAGEFERALRSFDRVIQIDRQSAEAYLYRGNAKFILGRYIEAERDYTSALETNFRARPESTGGTFRTEGITIMEPNPSARDNDVYALLYNNRGAAKYLQGNREAAKADFDLALEFSPNLEFARQNRATSNGSGSGRTNDSRPSTPYPYANTGSSNRRGLDRPSDPVRWDDIDELTDQAIDLRDYREDGRMSGLSGLFQPRPFKKRTIPRRGKVYKQPNLASATQNYIRIEEVEINDRETLVTIVVENRERRSFYARIFPPGRPESYVLVDRNPDTRTGVRYELLDVSDEEITRSSGVMVRPGEEFSFVLTFRKLDDGVGYVNLVEGSLQVEHAWNFYSVDLTR